MYPRVEEYMYRHLYTYIYTYTQMCIYRYIRLYIYAYMQMRYFVIFLMEKSLKIRNLVQCIHLRSRNAPQARKNLTFSLENVVLILKPSRMHKFRRLEAPQARRFFIYLFGLRFFQQLIKKVISGPEVRGAQALPCGRP